MEKEFDKSGALLFPTTGSGFLGLPGIGLLKFGFRVLKFRGFAVVG